MSVIKTKNGWAFRTSIKNPITGERKQPYRSGFKTKKEAQFAEVEFITTFKSENYFNPSNEVMKTFINKWLNNVYKHEVQITTFERAQQVIKTHILPEFAEYEVSTIKTYDIQQFLSDKSNSGLAQATVKIIKNVLSKAFQTAVDWELIKKNPTERVKVPSIVKKEKEVWTAEEAKVFLENCDQLRWLVAFTLALHTGMRRGEILALKWKNVDLEQRTIKIKESLAYTKEKGLIFKSAKTTNSVREIVIPPSLVDLLMKIKEEQKEIKRRMGPSYNNNDLVICTEDGKPIYLRNLLRTFKRIIHRAGVKEITLHDLRHSNATLLMKQGINPKIVSERLGHANVGITLDIYSHTDLEMQKESVYALDRMLNNS